MKKKFNIHPSFENEYLNYKEQELLNKMRKKQQRELRQLQFKEERQMQEQQRKHFHQKEEQIKQQQIQENIRKKKEQVINDKIYLFNQSQQYQIQREIQKLQKVSSLKEFSERNYHSQEDLISNRSKTNSSKLMNEKSLVKKIAELIQSQQQSEILNKKQKVDQNLKSHEQLLQERKELQLKEQIKIKQLQQIHQNKVHQRYQEELDLVQLDRNEKWNNYQKKWSELMSQQAIRERESIIKKREKAKSMQLLIDHKDRADKLLKQTIDEKLQKINSKNEKINKFVYEKNYLHDLINALEHKQKSTLMKYYN